MKRTEEKNEIVNTNSNYSCNVSLEAMLVFVFCMFLFQIHFFFAARLMWCGINEMPLFYYMMYVKRSSQNLRSFVGVREGIFFVHFFETTFSLEET